MKIFTIPATKKKIPKKKDKNIFPIPKQRFNKIDNLVVNIVLSSKAKHL